MLKVFKFTESDFHSGLLLSAHIDGSVSVITRSVPYTASYTPEDILRFVRLTNFDNQAVLFIFNAGQFTNMEASLDLLAHANISYLVLPDESVVDEEDTTVASLIQDNLKTKPTETALVSRVRLYQTLLNDSFGTPLGLNFTEFKEIPADDIRALWPDYACDYARL